MVTSVSTESFKSTTPLRSGGSEARSTITPFLGFPLLVGTEGALGPTESEARLSTRAAEGRGGLSDAAFDDVRTG